MKIKDKAQRAAGVFRTLCSKFGDLVMSLSTWLLLDSYFNSCRLMKKKKMKITADVKPGEAQRHLSQYPMMSFFQDSLVILTQEQS